MTNGVWVSCRKRKDNLKKRQTHWRNIDQVPMSTLHGFQYRIGGNELTKSAKCIWLNRHHMANPLPWG